MTRIALLVETGATQSSIAITLDMFNIARRYPAAADCQLDLFSIAGGKIALSPQLFVATHALPSQLDDYAAVILPGFFANDIEALDTQLQTHWPPVIDCLRRLSADTLIAASCYGTFILGASGLLDGVNATTTWWFQDEFRQRYPRVQLDPDQALADGGRCMTAGAMTAHTELALHLLRRLFGVALARSVGGIMLIDGAKTSQRPFMSPRRDFADPLVQQAVDWLSAHEQENVSTAQLAELMCTSSRTLQRRFFAATGLSPLAYLQDLRIEHAKEMLETTRLSLEQIVEKIGYSDVSAFRRLFTRRAGLSPAQYRQHFCRRSRSSVPSVGGRIR